MFDDDDDDGDDDDEEEEEGNSRQPLELDDIPNLTRHWPCAVKTHFPGQHTRPGRNVSKAIVKHPYELMIYPIHRNELGMVY